MVGRGVDEAVGYVTASGNCYIMSNQPSVRGDEMKMRISFLQGTKCLVSAISSLQAKQMFNTTEYIFGV